MKKFLHRIPFLSARLVLLTVLGGITMVLFGCMGGGGSGGIAGPSSEDRAQVVERVQSLLKVLASGDGSALDAFRRSTPAEDIPDGGRFQPLFVRDLGTSLSDPNDGNTFTFFFDPNEITFPSPSLAVVPLWTWFCNGEKFALEIRLVKLDDRWYLEDLKMATFDLTQAAGMGGAVPSSALWPMVRDNRWQFVEIQAPSGASVRPKVASRVSAMVLNATRVDFRTLVIGSDSTPGPEGRQTFRLQMSSYGSGLATSQLDLPIDPGTFEFGRFSTGISAVDRGFFPQPSGKIPGSTLWDILDPSRQGFIRAFEESGLYLEGGDSSFNGGHPWRLADLLVQDGAAATQSITLSVPGSGTRTGEARILIMESVPVNLSWIQGLARRFDICLTWNGSAEVTWTSLFFLPGMGLVGYADYDLTTRHPVRFAWLWGASVSGRQFLPPGETGTLAPFVTLGINPVEIMQWRVGTPLMQSLTASGGQSPYVWSLSGAPAWVTIETGTGRMNGTPAQAGSYSFDITVRDAGDRVATLPVQASVASAPAPVFSGMTPLEGFQGGSPVPVEVTGQNFFGTPQIRLATSTGLGPVATGLTLVDAGRLSCALPLTGIATGLWSIEVVNPDGQVATGMNSFRVRPEPASVVVTLNQASGQVDPASATVIHYTAIFGNAVSGFSAEDVTLGGTAAPTTCTVVQMAPNNGTIYDVAVSGMTQDGTVTASIPANIVQDTEGNWNQPSTSTDNQVTLDSAAPTVMIALAAGQVATTSANTANFTVTFSEPVTGFAASGVLVSAPAGGNPTAVVAAVSSTTYAVTLGGMTIDGSYSLSVFANAALDQAGSGNLAAPSPAMVTRDSAASTVMIALPAGQVATTSANTANFTVTFSEPVTGFAASGVLVSAPSGGNPTTVVTAVSSTTYTVTLGGMTIDGLYSLAVSANAAVDQAGSGNLAAPSPAVVTRDSAAPTVMIALAAGQVATTTGNVASFSVTFSEPVTGFTAADVQTTYPVGAPGVAIETVSSTTFSIILTMGDDGKYSVSVPAGAATDQAGNTNTGPASASVGRDATSPGVSVVLAAGQAAISNGFAATFTVTFTEPVTGFGDAANDIAVTVPGGGGYAPRIFTAVSPTIYTVTLDGLSMEGLYSVSVPAGVASDLMGLPNTSAPAAAGVTLDRVAPGVVVTLAAGQLAVASATAATFTVTFDEPVTGFGDIAGDVNVAGPAGSVYSITPVSVTTYTVSLTNMTAEGDYSVTVLAGVASDTAGTGNTAAPAPALVKRDTTAPAVVVTLAPGQAAVSNQTAATFSVTFSEPVTGFGDAVSDFQLSGPGLTGAPVFLAVSPTTYTVTIDSFSATGSYDVLIAGNVASDQVGIGNNATTFPGLYTYDADSPGVSVARSAGQSAWTNLNTASFTVTFTEGVTGFGDTLPDITVGGPVTPGYSVTEVSSTTYTVFLTGMATDGIYSVQIPAAVASDVAGNANSGPSILATVTRDAVAPVATISQYASQGSPTNTTPVNFQLVFSEPVQGDWVSQLSNSGTVGPASWAFMTSDPDFRVFVIGAANITGSGTVLPAMNPAGITDQAGNPLTVDVTASPVVFDNVPPSVTKLGDGLTNYTFQYLVPRNLVFSEPISATSQSNIQTAIASWGFFSFTWTTPQELTITANSTNVIIPADVATNVSDLYGNVAPTLLLIDSTADGIAPTVTIQQAAAQADPTNGASIIFDVVFSEPVTGFTNTDVVLSGTALPTTPTVTEVSPLDGTTYQVAVSGMSAEGTIIAIIPAGSAQDIPGNLNLVSTTTDNQVTRDITGPTVTINQEAGQADPTNAASILYTVVFSEPVTSFTGANVVLSGTAGATTATVSGTGPIYTISVTGMTGDGTVIATINANSVPDLAGNQNIAGTFTDNQVTRDITPPTMATVLGDGVNPYSMTSSPQSFTFSEPLILNSQITIGNAIAEVSGSNNVTYGLTGTTFTFTVNVPVTVYSDIAINITDVAGNVANLTVINTGADSTPPTVTTLGDGSTPITVTYGGPLDLVFSEPLSEASKAVVQNALTAAKVSGGSLHYVWVGATLTIEPFSGTVEWNNSLFVADISDRAGNVTPSLQLLNIPLP